ncbi:MAG: phosphatase PAP2 family protein [Phycisphaerales bacterium]|nr:phosphatase PAP2 family protein [Phycisphaerales bacterium]
MIESNKQPGSLPRWLQPAYLDDPTNRRWFFCLAATLIVAGLLCWFFADQQMAQANYDFRSKATVLPAEFLTTFGRTEPWIASFLAILIAARIGRFQAVAAWAWFGLLSIILSGLLVPLIKITIGRVRPGLFLEEGIYGFQFFEIGYHFNSCPSGHATTIATACTVFWLMNRRLGPLWVLIAAAVGATRVILEAHFMSDVFMGFLTGVTVTLLIQMWWISDNQRKFLMPYEASLKLRQRAMPTI